jgi:asparagine synthase (glutamine-hydrolysing)
MCGIVGILENNKKVELDLLKKMSSTLKHRGPDDEGYYTNPGGNLGLGFRRLSIIDLKTGHQPISNENKSIWVILNGEIYNFRQLREELEQKGHRFYTSSDTEVLVHLYEEEGVDCLKYLRGMFAFCIWDDNKKMMFLARDRVGKKPLVYAEINGGVVFASEIKAILQYPGFTPAVNHKSLDHYLTYGYSLPGESMFRGVKKLPPAHYLICDKDGLRINRYWSLSYENKLKLKEEEYREVILDTLSEAVKLRLISDVPLGVLLSGGVDSSCVVALASQFSSHPLETFSIGFEEEDYSELKFAKLVAKAFGTKHHEFVVKPNMLDVLPKIIWHYNEPFGDSSCIPTYYVSKIAREQVTVALNGDGGDESFAGYERYIGYGLARKAKLIPSCLLRLAGFSLNKLNRGSDISKFSKVCAYINMLARYKLKYIYPRLLSFFNPEEKELLCTEDFKMAAAGRYPFDFLADIMDKLKLLTPIDRVMATDILTYLPEDLLVKMDIATMANSLEGRSPFLDHKVMEMAARIPQGLKLKGITTKYILKKSFSGIVPKEILTRGKMGFGVPIGRWFKKDLTDFVSSVLLSEEFYRKGYFKKEFVARLLKEHVSGKANHTSKIWNLLNFELWHRMFISKTWQCP